MVPQEISHVTSKRKVMKELNVSLNVTTTSDVRKMGHCPKDTQGICGINYRSV